MPSPRAWLPHGLILLLLLVGAFLLVWNPPPPGGHRALDLPAPPQGGDFTLSDENGPLSLADLRGQVVALYFGYTWCPDICPTNLGYLALALGQLTERELARVQVLFISLDPERDTPERLAQYTAFFHPRVRGLTGTPEQIAQAANRYGVAYRKVVQETSATGYLVDHSAYTYLIDPRGHLRGTLEHATPPARILAAIRALLADDQGGAPP